MKDLSIEYAHIYTNNKIGEEHKLSLGILRELRSNESNQHHETSLVIMVDDYSFPDPSFDYDAFVEWLTQEGFKPDVVVRESQMIPACDEVLRILKDEHLKEEVSDYIRSKKKYPCSLFIAAWYLVRLGHITHPAVGQEWTANKLINILPSSFKPFEDKALEMIAVTPFGESVNKIEHKYFEGRILA